MLDLIFHTVQIENLSDARDLKEYYCKIEICIKKAAVL